MKRAILIALVVVSGCATTGGHSKIDGLGLRKQLGRTLIEHHEWAAATQPLLQVLATSPRDPEAHMLLGIAYREQGLYDEAERELTRAVDLEPRMGDAWGALGLVREERRDDGDQALEDFKKAIALNPNNSVTYNNYGFALYVRGKYEDAVRALREGLRRDPGSRRMRNNLGFVYGRLGLYNRAKREFERGGSKAEAESNLGFVFEQAGDSDHACERYQEAMRLDPTLAVAQANAEHVCPTQESKRE